MSSRTVTAHRTRSRFFVVALCAYLDCSCNANELFRALLEDAAWQRREEVTVLGCCIWGLGSSGMSEVLWDRL
jgi:hypothetical protein